MRTLRQARLETLAPFGSLLYCKSNILARKRVVQRVPREVTKTKSISSFLWLFCMAKAPDIATSLSVGMIFRIWAKKRAFLSLDFEYFCLLIRRGKRFCLPNKANSTLLFELVLAPSGAGLVENFSIRRIRLDSLEEYWIIFFCFKRVVSILSTVFKLVFPLIKYLWIWSVVSG